MDCRAYHSFSNSSLVVVILWCLFAFAIFFALLKKRKQKINAINTFTCILRIECYTGKKQSVIIRVISQNFIKWIVVNHIVQRGSYNVVLKVYFIHLGCLVLELLHSMAKCLVKATKAVEQSCAQEYFAVIRTGTVARDCAIFFQFVSLFKSARCLKVH